ncbi:MAG: hypothetical protein AB1805_12975 [Nitrospirota bacterium]
MRVTAFVVALGLVVIFGMAGRAEAQVDVGISIGEEGLRGFHLAVGEYYHVPQREVIIIIKEKRIRDEELPVVLFLAQRARVPYTRIVELRQRGMSWIDITLHFGLSPEIYYVPVKVVSGPPYGKAYGYYKKKPKKEWKAIRLDDDDVVNFVNLKFISGYHGYSPERVIELRSRGRDFVAINDEVKREKGRGRDRNKERDKDREHGKLEKEHGKKEKNKDKGKGHGKFE